MKNTRNMILPKVIDNTFKGHIISKYMFLIITVFTIIRSLIHIFAADGGAQSIATIPLNAYPLEASQTIIMMFALWGLSQLLMGFVFIGVYFKYQSLIPAMYILLIIEYAMRIMIGVIKPITLVGTAPGGIGNYILIPLCVALFYLSLNEKRTNYE